MENTNRKNDKWQLSVSLRAHSHPDSGTTHYFISKNFHHIQRRGHKHGCYFNGLKALQFDLLYPQ